MNSRLSIAFIRAGRRTTTMGWLAVAVMLAGSGWGIWGGRAVAQELTEHWTLGYSSLLGGGGLGWSAESGQAVGTDRDGHLIVGGYTEAPDFPNARRLGPPDMDRGGFVVRFDPSGRRILFSVVLGGAVVRGLGTDEAGNIYAVGECAYGFPTTNAIQSEPAGDWDAFAAKFSPAGDLLYSTLLGGSREDLAWSVAVDREGNAYVAGWTRSADFPITSNAPQTALAGGTDAFVAKLDPAGAHWSFVTFLGGVDDDLATSVALGESGGLYVAGRTLSSAFTPATPPSVLGSLGWQNGFLARLTTGGDRVEALTLMGATNSQTAVAALAVDATGHAYVFGSTDATHFPVTPGCWQAANAGGMDNFLAKLNPAGTAFEYATYLGGSGQDEATVLKYLGDGDVPIDQAGVAVDALGNAYVVGRTDSSDLAPAGIAASAYGGNRDGYVAVMDPSGSRLRHLRYLGGLGEDVGLACSLDARGDLWMTGSASPALYPPYFPVTADAPQLTFANGSDGFVARLTPESSPPANDAFATRATLAGPRVTAYADDSQATREAASRCCRRRPAGTRCGGRGPPLRTAS